MANTIKSNANTEIGKIIPNNTFLNPVNTKVKSLHDVKADKKIIILWSSTCSHCEKEIGEMFKNINYYTKSYVNEEFIAFRGDKVECYMILLEGELVAEMQKINGKVVKIENLTAFSDIAPAFVFGQDNNVPIDLYAVKPSKILYIPKNEFM